MRKRASQGESKAEASRSHSAQRSSPFFPAAGRGGEAAPPPFFQPKLRVGEPGDRFEREADKVAGEVVAGGAAPPVQAKIAAGSAPEEELQRHAAGPGAPPAPEEAELQSASSGEGRPLPKEVRGGVEAAFGADFSPVRIHTGEAAATMSEGLGANAFTHGRDIYFARGRFAPETREGRHLLAHELTHVVQQGGGAATGTVQADFAVAPTQPRAAVRTLTAQEITDAIAFNTPILTQAAEISLVRDVLGISPTPATLDAALVQAIASYQAGFNLPQDGKLDSATRQRLGREIFAEAEFLGFTGLVGLATGVMLRTQIRALIDAGDLTYATYKTRIQAATTLQRDVVLADPATLRALRDLLPWNDFARCVELLGRQAPNHAFLITQTVVLNALQSAWTDSTPGLNPPLAGQHEEGGWVFLDLITGDLTVRRQAAGATATIDLTSPPTVADSIVVAKFHTHPNLDDTWIPGPGPTDTRVDAGHGVPDIVAGNAGVDPAHFDIFPSGPDRRAHLAGNRGLPGAAGGLAPQERWDRRTPGEGP